MVDKLPTLHFIPEDWKIFVGIAAYRDLDLVNTLRNLVSQATYPERLRIVIYNQFDLWGDWDQNLLTDLKNYIKEAS